MRTIIAMRLGKGEMRDEIEGTAHGVGGSGAHRPRCLAIRDDIDVVQARLLKRGVRADRIGDLVNLRAQHYRDGGFGGVVDRRRRNDQIGGNVLDRAGHRCAN